jgi:hypothetical protein
MNFQHLSKNSKLMGMMKKQQNWKLIDLIVKAWIKRRTHILKTLKHKTKRVWNKRKYHKMLEEDAIAYFANF